MEPIVEIIKRRRQEAGLTQQQLAEKSGIGIKTYRRIEQGADMRLSQYRAVIRALGIADLDVSLDMLDVEHTKGEDVAAAARLLTEESRRALVQIIVAEWERSKDGE
ncbi:helix-turn-helix transcriptional regulator [Enterovibrio norvegicus]|uniref:helix-turn-helix transcriptional regulator n=1 Tax=Enterovibrio norvegicus TaxID=188144 RepID=UPI000C831913|nr:helix-turn-helix transcriptional regulator [Enterovibrio norvegicus]PMN68398.1 transcriptional regulator [Enterovibrio norvegicus]